MGEPKRGLVFRTGKEVAERSRELLRCTCLEYGHGLSLTRVVSPSCVVHGPKAKP